MGGQNEIYFGIFEILTKIIMMFIFFDFLFRTLFSFYVKKSKGLKKCKRIKKKICITTHAKQISPFCRHDSGK